MTIRKTLYKENVQHPADNDRRFLSTLFSGVEGRLATSDFSISNIVGLSYSVAAGKLATPAPTAGSFYMFDADDVSARNSTTASSSNPRNDLICAKIANSFISGSSDIDDIVVLPGDALSSTPMDPTLPTDAAYVKLWRVRVNANASVLTMANFTDLRPRVTGLAGTALPVSGVTDRDSLNSLMRPGSAVFRTDTNLPEWFGQDGAWKTPFDLVFSILGVGGLRNIGDANPLISSSSFSSTPNGLLTGNGNLFGTYGSFFSAKDGSAGIQLYVGWGNQLGVRTWNPDNTANWNTWRQV